MPNNKPYISVVLPTWNRARVVSNAVMSILDQDYDDWELIVVNDGSADNTKDVLNRYKRQDSRIRVLNNSNNLGISASRNRGNRSARGEVIVVQDSDDVSLPNRLEHIADAFRSTPELDVLYHWFFIRGIDVHYGERAMHRELHRCGDYSKHRALTEPYIPGHLAYRKRVADDVPYRRELKCSDDWGWIIDATLQDKVFAELKQPIYEYVISEDAISVLGEEDGRREVDMNTIKRILTREYDLNVT